MTVGKGLIILLLVLIPLNTFAQITGEDIENISDELAETSKNAIHRITDKIGDMKIGQFFTNLSDTISVWWVEDARSWLENNFNNTILFFNRKVIIE